MRSILAMTAAALVALLTMTGLESAPARADDGPSGIDEKRVEQIVEKLLRERPEIIVDALTAYKQKQEMAEQERQVKALSLKRKELFEKPGDPFIGNPDAAITVVEFFDYNCGYCKRAVKDVSALARENEDVKVVFKEFPILGDPSVVAARVSLAVNEVAPKKYGEFHDKVMTGHGSYDEESLLSLAGALGIDTAAVREKLADKAIADAIRENYQLAKELGIRGTPTFVIGDELVRGAVSQEALERVIARQRG